MRPRITAPFCGAAAALLALGLAVPSARADEVGFIAKASGQGFRAAYVVPGQFVVEQVWDFGGPVAQAQVDPSGGAAFGSLPFPGEAAIVAPGLAFNLAGLPSPPATYPFYAGAQYPSVPSAKVSDPSGNYQVTADADAGSAASSAIGRAGPKEANVASSAAHSAIRNADGKVTATAETTSQGISLADGTLTIGSAVSKSISTLAGGQVERKSELVLNGLMVAGTPVGMGPDGFDDQAVNDVLENAGLQVRIAHQSQSPTGASADVLEITVSHPIPGGGGATGVMVYRFGGASTEILTGAATEEAADGSAVTASARPADAGAQPLATPLVDRFPAAGAPVALSAATAPLTRPLAGPASGVLQCGWRTEAAGTPA